VEAEALQKLIIGFHFPTQQLASDYKSWHSKEVVHPSLETANEYQRLLSLEMPSQLVVCNLKIDSQVLNISFEQSTVVQATWGIGTRTQLLLL
jgi:hypothetical protein